MAFTWRKVGIRMVRVVARMVLGIGIGIVVVIAYIAIDYMGATDKRLYFIDYRDAIITLLVLGWVIGGLVGMAWAFIGRDQSSTMVNSMDSNLV